MSRERRGGGVRRGVVGVSKRESERETAKGVFALTYRRVREGSREELWIQRADDAVLTSRRRQTATLHQDVSSATNSWAPFLLLQNFNKIFFCVCPSASRLPPAHLGPVLSSVRDSSLFERLCTI